ncbi:MAG: phage tail protein [Candidatus Korobacteraceae bacterium]|jgi:phage tail-like protein
MSTSSLTPLHVFKFQVDFFTDSLSDDGSHEQFPVCSGSFAECTGLEATMEPKSIKEGGRNYGVAQRAGGTTFATVVLKRGISSNQNMYQIFNSVSTGTFAPRMQVTINLFDIDGSAVLAWQLDKAMPIKYKFSDLNSKNSEIGIEELHLVHEGLWSATPTVQQL